MLSQVIASHMESATLEEPEDQRSTPPPYAGLLISPNLPFGNSSQVAALFSSPFPASTGPAVDTGLAAKDDVAVVDAAAGVILRFTLDSEDSCFESPILS